MHSITYSQLLRYHLLSYFSSLGWSLTSRLFIKLGKIRIVVLIIYRNWKDGGISLLTLIFSCMSAELSIVGLLTNWKMYFNYFQAFKLFLFVIVSKLRNKKEEHFIFYKSLKQVLHKANICYICYGSYLP